MQRYTNNKKEYFLNGYYENLILNKYPIVGEYSSSDKYIIVRGKYSLHKISLSRAHLCKGLNLRNSTDKTEFMLNRLQSMGSGNYTYPNFVFTKVSDKIHIYCKSCEVNFTQELNAHLKGQGCSMCANIGAPKMCNEEFLDRLSRVNTDIEVLEEYKGYDTNILVRNRYGICRVPPNRLLKGSKGTLRTAVDKTLYMKSQFIEKHKGFYAYPNFVYKGNREMAKIECPIHGEFEQSVDVHLMGSGCSKCAFTNSVVGYSRTDFVKMAKGRKVTLYLIKCSGNGEDFYKIGITSLGIRLRFKDNYKMPYNYIEVFKVVSECPESIWDLENRLKKMFVEFQYIPTLSFSGMYECLSPELPINAFEEVLKGYKVGKRYDEVH